MRTGAFFVFISKVRCAFNINTAIFLLFLPRLLTSRAVDSRSAALPSTRRALCEPDCFVEWSAVRLVLLPTAPHAEAPACAICLDQPIAPYVDRFCLSVDCALSACVSVSNLCVVSSSNLL